MALLLGVLAFAIACGMVPVAVSVAQKTGMLDRPRGYKAHGRITPYLGGLALLVAIVLPLGVLLISVNAAEIAAMIAGGFVLWTLGTADDRWNLRPDVRVVVTLVVAAGAAAAGLGGSILTNNVLDGVITSVFLLGVVNAYNLMDNMDGAALGTAGVTCVVVGAAGAVAGFEALTSIGFIVGAACGGVLMFNFAPAGARIFLGDGGSMPLGFLVGCLLLLGADLAGLSGGAALAGLALGVGLPALDVGLVMFSRRRGGRPLAEGGRDHLTHRLAAVLGRRRAVWVLIAVQVGIVLVATTTGALAEHPAVIAGAAILACAVALVCVARRLPGSLEAPAMAGAVPARRRDRQ